MYKLTAYILLITTYFYRQFLFEIAKAKYPEVDMGEAVRLMIEAMDL